MTRDRWLDDTQATAWRSLLVVVNEIFPELERTFAAHDLLHVDYAILAKLSEADGGSLRLGELAAAVHISRARLSHRMRHLVAEGLVGRLPDVVDLRGGHAIITRRGRNRLAKVAPDHARDVLKLIFDHLDDDQTAALADSLQAVARHVPDEGS